MDLPQVVIENVEIEDNSDDDDGVGDVLVLTVRARKGAARRCRQCGRRSPWYDNGGGVRRWRHLDFGTVRVELQAAASRVNCREHGPTVVRASWARHASRFTTAFEDTCAWLVARTAASTVSELLRVSWRATTGIAARIANNTHLRLLTRQGYGYHSANALIAMAMLRRGGVCPPLPGTERWGRHPASPLTAVEECYS